MIATNRHTVAVAEAVVAEHVRRWERRDLTPAAPHFDELSAYWGSLRDGGELTVGWLTFRILASDEGALGA